MLILLLYRTVINSLQFKIIEPSFSIVLSQWFLPFTSRIEGPHAFVKWRRCVMAPVFSSEIFIQVYLSLHRMVSMLRTAENKQQHFN